MATNTRPTARRGPSGALHRLKPIQSDPLDAYGLPSKGEKRLQDPKAQENFYTKILERYMKFCAATGSGNLSAAFSSMRVQDPAPPPSQPRGPAQEPEHRGSDLPNILLAMRKLREAILSTQRADAFSQRAYMLIIRASILAGSWEAYQPALLYLLRDIHRRAPLSGPEFQEFAGYWVLDLACRQYELVEAFAMRRVCRVRDRKVRAALAALVADDWVGFWRIRHAVDGHQREIMGFAAGRMRMHALKCLGRSYLNADKAYVERCGDSTWEELVNHAGVGWQLQDNGNVMIRKPKPK